MNVKFGSKISKENCSCYGCFKEISEGEKVHSQLWNDNGIRRENVFCQHCVKFHLRELR